MRRVLSILALLSLTLSAAAGQRLIGPGDEWSAIDAASVAPGDEIVLMPGRHRPAVLRGLTGTGAKPIVIRSLAPDRPAVIDADHEGLRLEGVRHVVIRDLRIEGATFNGLVIAAPMDHDRQGGPWRASIRVLNVIVERTGPTGRRHGVQLAHVDGVTIERCVVHGWGGAGIDVTGCRDVQVAHCTFEGLDDHSQQAAVQVRGGSRDVRINDCRMTQAGLYPIMLGGADDPQLTATGEIVDVTPTAATPAGAPGHQVAEIQVMRCIIRGGGYPVCFSSATDCRVRNLTIVEPEHGVVAIDLAPAESSLVPSTGLSLTQSLVVWRPGSIDRLFRTGPRAADGGLTLGSNLWWSPAAAQGPGPFTWPGQPTSPQVVDVDPQLDAELAPQTARAILYGAFAP
jgi:hypothetical protein